MDKKPQARPPVSEWPVTFKAASDAMLESSLAATPAQRLAWLEEALTLAARAARGPRD